MPELPEVETIKRDLSNNVLNRQINSVEFLWPGILKEMGATEFENIVINKKIKKVERRAKSLNINLGPDINLLFHMKMTGHLIFTDDSWQVSEDGKWEEHRGQESPLYDPLNQYIRAIFYLSGDKILAFSDLRKFGYVKVLSDADLDAFFLKYGPEPLSDDFNVGYLGEVFKKKNLPIKKVIMDQSIIAGIGNIYADEILFESKIHPLTKASALNDSEIMQIVTETKKILSQAIEMRGTSTSDFRDTSGKKGEFGNVLSVYRRTGLPCPNDGTPIERIVVGGRGTHFCPKEQVQK
jgi:formamidopyrimidine-DNA glycosylase